MTVLPAKAGIQRRWPCRDAGFRLSSERRRNHQFSAAL